MEILMLNGDTFYIDRDCQMILIAHLKRRIQATTGILVAHQVLYHLDLPIQNHQVIPQDPPPFYLECMSYEVIPNENVLRQLVKDIDKTTPYGPIEYWAFDPSITNMSGLLMSQPEFNKDISGWDTQYITDMSQLFEGCSVFNQPIGGWDVGKVIDFSHCFAWACRFNQSLRHWDTSQTLHMNSMFIGATDFNQDLDWDVRKVITMGCMFYQATHFNGDIRQWKTPNLKIMDNMFREAIHFNQPIGHWNTHTVEYFGNCFQEASQFNQSLHWDLYSARDLSRMFYKADRFNGDITNWNVPVLSQVKRASYMFSHTPLFQQDLSSWMFPRNCNTSYMFYESPKMTPSLLPFKQIKKGRHRIVRNIPKNKPF